MASSLYRVLSGKCVVNSRQKTNRNRLWEAERLATMQEQGRSPLDDKWKTRYKEPLQPIMGGMPIPPEGWCWVSPDQLSAGTSNSMAIGPFGSNLTVSDYGDDGIPLIFVRNIRSGIFGTATDRRISIEKAAELSSHTAFACYILVTKMGEPPGDAECLV